MDGVSEDFSGLPDYKTREDRRNERIDRVWEKRRSNPYRGRRARVLVAGGFALGLLLVALALIMLFAPTPYLGMSHGALASSVGDATGRGCHPQGDGWICARETGGAITNYKVKVDWAGCWTGNPVGKGTAGKGVAASGSQSEISGCVSIMDHLTGD